MENLEKIPLKQIIEDYESGQSLEEIKQNRSITLSIPMIKSILLEYGAKKGRAILLQELKKEIPRIEEIVVDYQQKKTIQQLSEDYHINTTKINDAIQQYKIITGEIFANNHTTNYREDIQTEEIIEDYKNGKTLSKIADEQRASVYAIRRRIEHYIEEDGDEIVKQHNRNKNTNNRLGKKLHADMKLPIKEIIELRKKGDTFEDIGKVYNIDAETIKQVVRFYYNAYKKYKKLKEKKIINSSMIEKYNRLGYSFSEIQEFCKENGYEISEEDIKNVQKVERGEDR